MTLKIWLLFLIMETTLCLSPGPAVFYVVSQGMRGGMRRGLPAVLGIITANAIYFALSATSLGALIAASGRFFTIIKWIGAFYLVYLGIMALHHGTTGEAVELTDAKNAASEENRTRIYFGGLTLQLANPKALLFFLALLPQFINPHLNILTQMSILAVTSQLPEFCILVGYTWLAHRAVTASIRLGITNNMNRWLGRIEGVALLSCATLVLKVNHVVS